jgi:hypothetical protein
MHHMDNEVCIYTHMSLGCATRHAWAVCLLAVYVPRINRFQGDVTSPSCVSWFLLKRDQTRRQVRLVMTIYCEISSENKF